MAEKQKYFKLIFCPPLTLVFFLIVAATLTPVVVHAVFVESTGQTGFVGYVKDSIVIKFDENFTKRLKATRFQRGRTGVLEIDKLAAQYGVRKIRQQFPGARKMFSRGRMVNLANWYKLHFNQAVNLEKVIDAFKKSNGVSDVQPIGIHEVHSPPNDPVFNDQWHLNQVGGGMLMPLAPGILKPEMKKLLLRSRTRACAIFTRTWVATTRLSITLRVPTATCGSTSWSKAEHPVRMTTTTVMWMTGSAGIL
jgi:hypothetical protein